VHYTAATLPHTERHCSPLPSRVPHCNRCRALPSQCNIIKTNVALNARACIAVPNTARASLPALRLPWLEHCRCPGFDACPGTRCDRGKPSPVRARRAREGWARSLAANCANNAVPVIQVLTASALRQHQVHAYDWAVTLQA
jgi:hypothetical protein